MVDTRSYLKRHKGGLIELILRQLSHMRAAKPIRSAKLTATPIATAKPIGQMRLEEILRIKN